MGCSGSKTKKAKEGAAAAKPQHASPPSPRDPTPREKAKRAEGSGNRANGELSDSPRPAAGQSQPSSGAGGPGARQSASKEASNESDLVVLPRGDWVHTEGTPFYYSEKENLYFHPPSCQFYDPTNEMWYDPEKDEWYCDE